MKEAELKEKDKKIEELKTSTKFRKLQEYEQEINKYYQEVCREPFLYFILKTALVRPSPPTDRASSSKCSPC